MDGKPNLIYFKKYFLSLYDRRLVMKLKKIFSILVVLLLEIFLISCSSNKSNPVSNPAEPNVTFSFSASRTSGVAPLGIFFNSGFSENTTSDNPFHDLKYSWDFGDTTSDYWAIEENSISERSKNTDKGPVSTQVYENPGTYTVTLNVRDETGIISNEQLSITQE